MLRSVVNVLHVVLFLQDLDVGQAGSVLIALFLAGSLFGLLGLFFNISSYLSTP
jgi:hypothetical protein